MNKYDLVLIGGGIVGVSTAWQLKQRYPGKEYGFIGIAPFPHTPYSEEGSIVLVVGAVFTILFYLKSVAFDAFSNNAFYSNAAYSRSKNTAYSSHTTGSDLGNFLMAGLPDASYI